MPVRPASPQSLGDLDVVLCDVDGVVLRGETPVPEAGQALKDLESMGINIVFCTNNSTRTPEDVSANIQATGYSCRPEQVITAAETAARVATTMVGPRREVFMIGGGGLESALRHEDLAPIRSLPTRGSDTPLPDVVVVGLDTRITYDAIHAASMLARRGASLIATNDDAVYPREDDYWPANGALLAAIEKASGCSAKVVGKPNMAIYEDAMTRQPGKYPAVIGDNPETDLAGGRALGFVTVWIQSGNVFSSQKRGRELADVEVQDLVTFVEHLREIKHEH